MSSSTVVAQNKNSMIGRKIGGCVIEALLGSGATGTVYRARQVSLDRAVALKVLHPHVATNEVLVSRFAREARAAASIRHPGLVQVIDFGLDEDFHYFTMELIEGSTLGDYLRAGRTFDEEWSRYIARVATDALDAAHSVGIVHRDVKPDNLILDSKGMLKVSDLGLARSEWEEEHALTMTGDTLGTPYYMSPEQVQDSRLVDYRSDYYSLAASLYHIAVGTPPYEGSTRYSVMNKHVEAPVPNAHVANPTLSKAFSDFLAWLLAKKPEERPSSAQEIFQALDNMDLGEPLTDTTGKRLSASTERPTRPLPTMPEMRDAFAELALASASERLNQKGRMPVWVGATLVALAVALGVAIYLLLAGAR